jgi:hypothetical protein
MKILTPTGFRSFDGVKRYWHEECLKFTFDDYSTLKTAFDHKFIVEGEVVFAREVKVGVCIGKVVTNIETLNEAQYFYDPVNVGDGSVFCHDSKFVSHNTFMGNGNTLISGDKLLQLKSESPLYRQDGVSVYEKPIEGHDYIMCVDVAKGRGQDYSTFNIIDISTRPFKQVGVYRNNMISPLLFPDIIYKYANTFNEAYVVVESNDQGSVVANGLYYELEYENTHVESMVKAGSIGMTMNRKVKRIGCSNLKDLVEQNKINIVDSDTILELSTFIAKGSSFEASDNNHDDLVMTLVMFGWFASSQFFSEMTDIDIKEMMYREQITAIENELTPFGIISTGLEPEYEVDDQGNVWETNLNTGIF